MTDKEIQEFEKERTQKHQEFMIEAVKECRINKSKTK